MAAKKRTKKGQSPVGASDEAFRRDAGARLATLLQLYDSRASAASIGRTSVDMLAEYVAGRSKIPLEVLVRLAEPKDISLDWLATGRGSARRESNTHMGAALGLVQSVEEQPRTFVHDGEPEGYYLVPVYRVTASSGHGSFPAREEVSEPMAFPRALLKRLASAGIDHLAIVFNRGESNEPDIMDGDAMLIDRGIERIADDAFYVFSYDDALMVKQIERMLDGRVALKARNPNYREEILSREDAARLKVFGRVVWRGGLV